MQDKNEAVINNGDHVIVEFTVFNADNEDFVLLQTKDTDSSSQSIPFKCPPNFVTKVLSEG